MALPGRSGRTASIASEAVAAGRHLRCRPRRRVGGATTVGTGEASDPRPRQEVAAALAAARSCCSTALRWSRCGLRRAPSSVSSAIRNRISPGLAISSCWRWSIGAASTSCSAPGCAPIRPSGRLAPVDDATARRLLTALNVVIMLPLIGAHDGPDRCRSWTRPPRDRDDRRALCTACSRPGWSGPSGTGGTTWRPGSRA